MKFKILKALDVAGLQVFDPIVRLAYGEQPKEQLRRIGLFIGVPVLTFAAFLAIWSYVAPRHTTKAGEVPTPSVVSDAAGGIWTFHQREEQKARDFELTGEAREKALAEVEARITELEPLTKEAAARVNSLEESARNDMMSKAESLYEPYQAEKNKVRTAAREREQALREEAEKLPPGDAEAREAFLGKLAEHQGWLESEKERLTAMKEEIDARISTETPELAQAKTIFNRYGEEMQFLEKRRELLSSDNQSVKLASEKDELEAMKAGFLNAEGGSNVFSAAEAILKKEQAIADAAGNELAKPWTFPRQIKRSILCAFMGFLIGTALAIPFGVLCGLSRVMMAALTPLIALFKPVSPIVWLPIVFIIVGGFISNPTDHWLINTLNALPILGAFDINPAFLASAITVALCSLWPTLVNTALGVAAVDKDHINVARVLRLGFWSRLIKIVVPSALPLIFAGLRISLGVGWMVLIAAELLSSSEGIGKFTWDMFNNGSSEAFAQLFVVVFVVGIIGLLLDRIMIVFQRLVSFDGAPNAI